jgi:hypothetical protein
MSAHSGAVPMPQPVAGLHVSVPLQKSPSSQSASTGVYVQLVASSHSSRVHSIESLQTTGSPEAQVSVSGLQVSRPLQVSMSSQSASLMHSTVWQLPLAGTQQTPSSQLSPASHSPASPQVRVSSHVRGVTRQSSPAAHISSSGSWVQVSDSSPQVSTVQGMPSSQGVVPATHSSVS